ncbi:MAG TPA: hypothetical protein VID74_04560 [Gemmatimonadales bacterium]|jgi:hypothetical protein
MRAPITRSALLLLTGSLAPVAGLHAQAAPTWSVNPHPVTAIGLVDGPADQELAGVSGARRLRDGRVVIANGKPLELRVYDAHGTFLRRIGRTGDGPGEFRGRLDLLPAGGDSLLVYDQVTQRLSLFGPDGKLWHEWPASDEGSPRGQLILFRRSFAGGVPANLTGCLRQVLTALPVPPPPALREVVSSGDGHFLVRVNGVASWTAYTARGTVEGTLRTPARFEVYEATRDMLVGKALLEDDVEQVQVLKVSAPAATGAPDACVGRVDSFPPAAKSERVAQFRRAMTAAITAGEMAYSNYARYVSTLDSLPALRDKLPPDAVFRVLRAAKSGWAGALFDKRSTLVCVMALADATLAGWSDGRTGCSE